VVLAPGGTDLSFVATGLERGALASRYPALLGKRVFLFLGRLDPAQKGLDLLVQAFAAAGLDGAALILGGPDYRGGRRQLERLVTTLRLPGPVVFLGPLHDKERLEVLAGADVFVHTSRWEGMPLAVLEAASMAITSLVTPPADPLRRLSASGGAVSVEPVVDAIAEGLRRLHRSSEAALHRMGERARETVVSEFQWQRSAEILTEAYAKYCEREATLAPAAARHDAQ
jgi:glycosyltransferase involved in cell wall biosynthesis